MKTWLCSLDPGGRLVRFPEVVYGWSGSDACIGIQGNPAAECHSVAAIVARVDVSVPV